MSIEQTVEEQPTPEVPESAPASRKRAAVVVKQVAPKCPCCHSDARSIASPDGYECIKCGTVFQAAVEPTLDGKTFADLFDSAKGGEEFVFPASLLRSYRSLDQLAEQNVTSVFSNGGIVAALVRAGFTVHRHVPNVVFSKPTTN